MDKNNVRVSVYLPAIYAMEAKRLAAEDDRTLAYWIRRLVVKEVERQQKK